MVIIVVVLFCAAILELNDAVYFFQVTPVTLRADPKDNRLAKIAARGVPFKVGPFRHPASPAVLLSSLHAYLAAPMAGLEADADALASLLPHRGKSPQADRVTVPSESHLHTTRAMLTGTPCVDTALMTSVDRVRTLLQMLVSELSASPSSGSSEHISRCHSGSISANLSVIEKKDDEEAIRRITSDAASCASDGDNPSFHSNDNLVRMCHF
jgi:hypothetical protein